MTTEIIDEDDWVEIDRPVKPGVAIADVCVTLSVSRYKDGRVRPARTFLSFRGEAAGWIEANGPRFRAQIGGKRLNHIRIVTDLNHGRFESFRGVGGVQRLVLGVMNVWPNEEREATEAQWDCALGWMRLTLPEDFAEPRVTGK